MISTSPFGGCCTARIFKDLGGAHGYHPPQNISAMAKQLTDLGILPVNVAITIRCQKKAREQLEGLGFKTVEIQNGHRTYYLHYASSVDINKSETYLKIAEERKEKERKRRQEAAKRYQAAQRQQASQKTIKLATASTASYTFRQPYAIHSGHIRQLRNNNPFELPRDTFRRVYGIETGFRFSWNRYLDTNYMVRVVNRALREARRNASRSS